MLVLELGGNAGQGRAIGDDERRLLLKRPGTIPPAQPQARGKESDERECCVSLFRRLGIDFATLGYSSP